MSDSVRNWVKVHREDRQTIEGLSYEEGTASMDCYSQNPDGSATKTAGFWTYDGTSVTEMTFSGTRIDGTKAGSVAIYAFDPDDEMFLIVEDEAGNLFVGEKNNRIGICVQEVEEEVPEKFLANA